MGKLAAWGAVAGIGGGLQDVGKMKHEKEMADLDAERASGLARLKSKLTGERDIAAEDRKQERDIAEEGRTEKRGIAASERKHEQDVEIQTQKDIAAMDRTIVSSSNSSRLTDRWKFHTDTVEEMDPNTGRFSTRQVTTVMDTDNAIPYQLSGNKFIPQGTDPESIEDAPEDHITALYENASDEAAEAFLRTYNYLPRDFMRNLQRHTRTITSSQRRPTGATE